MTKTFAERCHIAQQFLPDAQYKAMLTALHTEMLAKLAEQLAPAAQQEPVAYIEHDDETAEPCPSCGKPLQSASGGGVVCSGRCGYWFCF